VFQQINDPKSVIARRNDEAIASTFRLCDYFTPLSLRS
jgi:hypothetical protein